MPLAYPGAARRLVGALAATLVALALAALLAVGAHADNASSAAGFIENAQNADGGFSETHRQPSSPTASLWATVALLAAGKNPQDERVNNGASADDYLAAHLSSYRSLRDLGLLAIVQAASAAPASRYGNPSQQLSADETVSAIRADPGGAALGVIGLLALHANRTAKAAAQTLLSDPLSDGGWGAPGDSDSTSTALVLEALAQSGVAGDANPAVQRGIEYLHRAQVNDGSIATSDRTDTSSSGDTAATAFTIQALTAMHHATLRTPTGTSVLQGLASYQQLSTGGLSPFGAYDTGVAPSVTQTAQSYPAFDGVAFPLPYVAPVLSTHKHTTANAANRASSGTASTGVSSNTNGSSRNVGAYRGASAAGSAKSRAGRGAAGQGANVSGQVVGATTAPKLTTRAGRSPAEDLIALYLALGLAAVAVAGAVLDSRRPTCRSRSAVAIAVQAASELLVAARRRKAFVPAAVVLVGAALIVLPSATGMWIRAPKGAAMITAFRPYMRGAKLDRLQTDVAVLDTAVRQVAARGPALQFPHATNAHQRFAAANPELTTFVAQWPGIHGRFVRLLDPMRANRANYAAVAGLPSFRLFPWFLLAPGVMLIALGAAGLIRPRPWRQVRWAVAGLGATLVLAPVALGLFSAGNKGAQLIAAFRTVEVRSTVTAVQDDFGSLAIGEGSLSTELPPRVAASLPAVKALNARWVAILGDFTPMLGVMSNNVTNYQAVESLPSFDAFPWLFVLPGVLAIVLALLSGITRPTFLVHSVRALQAQLQARSSP